MKNRSLFALLLLTVIVTVTLSSCASQRHNGCPMSTGAANNTKFRA